MQLQSVMRIGLGALAAGLGIGAVTLGGQAILPGVLNQLANSGAVWVIVGFVMGRFAGDWKIGALVGFVALVGEVVGYFATAFLVGVPESNVLILFWLGVALVAGPLLGAAGYASTHLEGLRQKIGTGALGAVFIGEGMYYLTFLNYRDTALLWLALALGITVLLTLKQSGRLQTLLVTVGLGLVFFAGELVLVWVDGIRAGLG